jgi:hypothetical protein
MMARDDTGFAATITDAHLLALYRYWLDKAGDRRMPARHDLDPVEMKPWLANLVLVEFIGGDPENYRVKLEGTNIEAYYVDRRTGHGIEMLTSPTERDLMMAQYGVVLKQARPAFFDAEFVNSSGKLSRQIKLLLPLSEDGALVNMVLGGIYFRPPEGLGR